MVRVKVCGFTREADVSTAVAAGVDAVGAIVDVPVDTPREVSPDRARELFAGAPPFVTTVLVTMSETVDGAMDLIETVQPDAVQLHGGPAPDSVSAVADHTERTVIASVGVDELDDVGAYEAVDAILVDSTDAAGAGGTGRTHDWDVTRRLVDELDVPIVLAGGLTPENVDAAIERVDPYAVDVASGVESAGGIKDHAALDAFVRAAKGPIA